MNVRTDFARDELVLFVSYAVVGLGAFLPWASPNITVGPADAGVATGIEGLGAVTLALAVVGAVVLLLADRDALTPIATAGIGAVVSLVGLWRIAGLGGPVSPGIGLYLTVSGGLGVAGVGAWQYRREEDDDRSTREAT